MSRLIERHHGCRGGGAGRNAPGDEERRAVRADGRLPAQKGITIVDRKGDPLDERGVIIEQEQMVARAEHDPFAVRRGGVRKCPGDPVGGDARAVDDLSAARDPDDVERASPLPEDRVGVAGEHDDRWRPRVGDPNAGRIEQVAAGGEARRIQLIRHINSKRRAHVGPHREKAGPV